MRFNTIIFVLLLGLLAFLFSCRLNKQERRLKKDSKEIEKLQGKIGKILERSPELVKNQSDTTQTEDSLEVGVNLEEDTAKIRDLLRDYISYDSAKKLNHENKELDLEQKAIRHQLFINKQNDIEHDLARYGFKPKVLESNGPNHHIKAIFDPRKTPELSLVGTIEHLIIHDKTTITLKEYIHKDISMKQAFWKLWPVWSVMLILSIVGMAIRLWIK